MLQEDLCRLIGVFDGILIALGGRSHEVPHGVGMLLNSLLSCHQHRGVVVRHTTSVQRYGLKFVAHDLGLDSIPGQEYPGDVYLPTDECRESVTDEETRLELLLYDCMMQKYEEEEV